MQSNPVKVIEESIILAILLTVAWILATDILLENAIPTALRSAIGFVYLTFIPGILISRILRLPKAGFLIDFLITVGLSLSFTMFFGMFINFVLPFFGISKPISESTIIIALFSVTLILYAICYGFKLFRQYTLNPQLPGVRPLNYTLYLLIILLLTIIATYLINFHNTNILSLIVILLIGSIPLLVAFGKLPSSLYPLAIFVISASLLYQHSLISNYLVGWDVHREAYRANFVLLHSIWDPSIYDSSNATLSMTTLAPVLSRFLGIDITWIFKAVYPFFFSLIPLGLYLAFRQQINEKYAFLASFFFMSITAFFLDLPALMRQGTAEVFLMLLIVLMLMGKSGDLKGRILLLIFTASLITAHYGVAYLFMLLLAASYILSLANKKLGLKLGNDRGIGLLNLNWVCLFIVFTLVWYMYTAASFNFGSIVFIGNHIIENIGELFNPALSHPLHLLTAPAKTWQQETMRALNITMQMLIAIGVTRELFKKEKSISYEHFLFSISCLIIWVVSLTVAGFSYGGSMDAQRIYGLTLLFLAPFCIIGGVWLIELFKKAISIMSKVKLRPTLDPIKVIAILLVVLLLFNIGFVEVITNTESPTLPSPLFFPKYEEDNLMLKFRLAGHYTREQDVFSVKWLSNFVPDPKEERAFYADYTALYIYYGMMSEITFYMLYEGLRVAGPSYLYLRYFNVVDKTVATPIGAPVTTIIFGNTSGIPALYESGKIYSNGGSEIYYEQRTYEEKTQ